MKRAQMLDLTPKKKAALVLMLLGPEIGAQVVQNFDSDQVEQLSLEVARLENVSPEIREVVINEFHELATAQDYIAEGGIHNAKKVLEAAFGAEQAEEILGRVMAVMEVVPFEFLRKADPMQLLTFIQDEHPQTIALILAYLPLSQSATILQKLPAETRAEVAERIAMMDQTPPEAIRRVEQVLERKVSSLISSDMSKAGGPKALVDLLNRVDRTTERMILENLSDSNPELADAVKNMMFVFEDIVNLDDRAIQQILKEVDTKDLGMALKGVGNDVQNKIYSNMSERAVSMLKEDMEFMGPVKVRAVEEAQQKIVAAIRRLEESGEITIGRGDDDVLI